MKKLLCLILCLVMACTVLVACDEEVIGDGIGDYPDTAEKVERLDLNLYIIKGDNMTDNAEKTVKTNISNHTKTAYNTVLNVFYVSESSYESTVSAAIAEGGKNVPHIVLINSKDFATDLIYPMTGAIPTADERVASPTVNFEADSLLADLTDYFVSENYGMLNTQIASSLIGASRLGTKLFTVPNNHVVGEYTYLVIDKEMARDTLKYGNRELMSYKSLEDASQLMADITALGEDPADYVKIVTGSYGYRDELAYITDGDKITENYVNVVATPVATSEEAFSTAFAIVNTDKKHNDRAMQLIYAINNDIELRNLLQYGFAGSNYRITNGDVVMVNDGINNYDMNLIYTGDIFKAYNCSGISWSDAEKAYGLLQNKDSIAAAE